jgi:RNA polymerase sigma factor (sigma-70 family)
MSETDQWTRITIDGNTIVERLRDPNDEEAWRLAYERYGSLIAGCARRLRLPPDLVEDARQDTMIEFLKTVREGKFDPQRGSPRQLLYVIARNTIIDLIKQRPSMEIQVVDETGVTRWVDRIPTEDELARLWEAEHAMAVRGACLLEAQNHFELSTYQMFILGAVEECPSAEVAELVGKNVNAVDVAKSKVRAFLSAIRPEIENAL